QGNVRVTADALDRTFFVTFGGPLAGTTTPPIAAVVASGSGTISVATVSTGPIQTVGLTAAGLQAMLNAMLARPISPGGGGGTASVYTDSTGTNYIVSFGGTLTGIATPALQLQNLVPNTSVTIQQLLTGGATGTGVAGGATLQLQSATGFTESSLKPLTLNGSGVNGAGALENVSGNNIWG